ncbi:hypothetical protein ACNKXS_09490 [Christiangramia marina]|uniref:hypothetical protein n=1 Tax=Christiangramia marina TaxID=409436 RepID=UPI003AA8620C
MRNFFILIFCAFGSLVYSQDHCKIRADISYTSSEKEYKIELDRRQNVSSLIIYKLSSERKSYSLRDQKRVDELRGKWKTAEEHRELEKIRNRYKIFDKDSILISNNSITFKYSDSLLFHFEKILDEKKDQPVYTDAMYVEIYENGLQKYKVYNPQIDIYSIVYYFIQSALQEYWKKVSKPILTKDYTSIY